MGLAALAPAGMARMQVALVDDIERVRRERGAQLGVDPVLHGHVLVNCSFCPFPFVD